MFILSSTFINGSTILIGYSDNEIKLLKIKEKIEQGNPTIFNQQTKGKFKDFPIKEVSYFSVTKVEEI